LLINNVGKKIIELIKASGTV